jgi:hypothetical protein
VPRVVHAHRCRLSVTVLQLPLPEMRRSFENSWDNFFHLILPLKTVGIIMVDLLCASWLFPPRSHSPISLLCLNPPPPTAFTVKNAESNRLTSMRYHANRVRQHVLRASPTPPCLHCPAQLGPLPW